MAPNTGHIGRRRRSTSDIAPAQRDREDGFTLIEVVMAFGLLILIMIPMAKFLDVQNIASGNLHNRVVASSLVDQMMESVQQQGVSNFANLSAGANGAATTTTQTVGGITYTLTTTKRWQSTSVAAGDCASNGNGSNATASTALLLVETAVSWPNMGGSPPVAATTTIAQPYGSGSSGTGSLELQAVGASGAGSPNIPVTLTEADTGAGYTYVTDSNGCLFVPNLPPSGTQGYTVKLSQPGWVTPQESATDTVAGIAISAGAVTSENSGVFTYDQGGTINVTYAGGTPPTGMPVTVLNSGILPTGTAVLTTSNTSVGPLYPYSNGYSIWLGDCTAATPSWAGSAAPRAGGTTNATVATTGVTFQVYDSTGPMAGGLVTVKPTGCTDTTTYPLPSMTSSSGTATTALPPGAGFVATAYSGATTSSPVLGTSTFTVNASGTQTVTIGSPPPMTTWSFTTAGATGTQGPTQTQVNTAYLATNLAGKVTVSSTGIQTWTAPYTGSYQFVVNGASGGGASAGLGASMTGTVNLTAGTQLRILVGQSGVAGTANPLAGGGGGGSFVADSSGTVYFVAGGGGGSGPAGSNGAANAVTGTTPSGTGAALYAASGGGYSSNGLPFTFGGGNGSAQSFASGGVGSSGGGFTGYLGGGHGGFGGGGGTCACTAGGGGGGGGWQGGGGAQGSGSTSATFYSGWGGSSYALPSATGVSSSVLLLPGAGSVAITFL